MTTGNDTTVSAAKLLAHAIRLAFLAQLDRQDGIAKQPAAS